MVQKPISHTFNRQTATKEVTVAGKTETVITALVIEAAEPVILTQDRALLGQPGHQYVPPTANLRVYGDVVTIKGELRLFGKDLLIVARKLLALPAEHAPVIRVDGRPLEDEVGKPKALLKGVNPPDNPAKGKIVKGQTGAPGYNTRIEPLPAADSSWADGGAGWSGPAYQAQMYGENGHDGAPGNRGGAVSILCDTLTVVERRVLYISTVGGTGGDGQSGQDGADGGDGGPGFDAVALPFYAYKNSTAGGNGGRGGAGGKGGRGGQGGSGGEVQVHVLSGEPPVSPVIDGGRRGEPGEGGAGGNPGRGGRAGLSADIATHRLYDDRDEMSRPSPAGRDGTFGSSLGRGDADPAPPSTDGLVRLSHGKLDKGVVTSNASVSQLVMMFERVRADYLVTDPEDEVDPATFADIKERLGWVTALLKEVPKTHVDFALAAAVLPAALLAWDQANQGFDYFGNGAYQVPSVSVGVYRGLLKTSLNRLKDVEKVADQYFTALREERDALASLTDALGQVKAQQTLLQGAKADLEVKMKGEAEIINAAEIRRKAARTPLGAKLAKFKDKVKDSFGLSPETLFNCLTQLSFTSAENPPGAAAMVAAQLGAIVTEGLKNITDDSGQLVNKSYVLGAIKSFASAELKTDFENTPTGEINDSASYQILAEFAKIKRMIDAFREKTSGAAEASIAIMDYIALLAERNRHIDYYNGLLRGLVQILTAARRLALDQQKVQDGLAANHTPGLTPMVNFVSGLYERAKADCIESLYMLSRAQSFWALEPSTSFYDRLGHTPQDIRHDQLVTAAGSIERDLVSVLENVRLTPNHFPAGDKGDHAQGALVVLTRKTHADFFEHLENWGHAQFALAPATLQSPAPDTILTPTMSAWTGETPPDPKIVIANPFHGKADVRLTKVRAWMVGMRTKNERHNVIIEHMGREVFRTPDDNTYPAPRENQDARIVHGPVLLPFRYSAEGLEFDGHFTPGKIDGVPGSEDGDLGYSAKATELGLPGTTGYAAIGPFATWRLIVREKDNPGLDLKSLHTVVMDFHGFHQSFVDV
jgi:hypothetical protein